ncbi:tripartite motif-containing protein 26-like [Rhinoraja longicauda]
MQTHSSMKIATGMGRVVTKAFGTFPWVHEGMYKPLGQVKASIQSLTKDKSGIQQMEQQQKEKISGVLEQSHNLQSKIASQFAELHQILTEKEQRVQADIREEEKRILNRMKKNLGEIEENLKSIQEELSKLQQQMDQKDSVVFLKPHTKASIRVNATLGKLLPPLSANLCIMARRTRSILDPQMKRQKESKLHCEEHQEELKLFCETDKKLICLVCRDAREHRDHRFMPVKEAVENYKDQVKSSIKSLTKKKSGIQQMEQQQKEKISGVLEQSHNLQSQITSQFVELHQILTEKEQRVLTDIQEEEKKILNTMEKHLQVIQENLNSIENEVKSLQEQLDLKDNVSFLKEEAGRKMRVHDEAKSLSVADGALPMERFDNPFFLNTIFRETTDVIKQVSVTLDVETAAPRLEVSEDRKRDQVKSSFESLTEKKSKVKKIKQKQSISGVQIKSHDLSVFAWISIFSVMASF